MIKGFSFSGLNCVFLFRTIWNDTKYIPPKNILYLSDLMTQSM